jgi:hypothetical protein
MDRFTLIDGVSRNAENPDTFEIPDTDEKAEVTIGDFVKLGFEYVDEDFGGERMWVKIVHTSPLRGTLANHPLGDELEYGDEIEFEARHIIGVMGDE